MPNICWKAPESDIRPNCISTLRMSWTQHRNSMAMRDLRAWKCSKWCTRCCFSTLRIYETRYRVLSGTEGSQTRGPQAKKNDMLRGLLPKIYASGKRSNRNSTIREDLTSVSYYPSIPAKTALPSLGSVSSLFLDKVPQQGINDLYAKPLKNFWAYG